MQAVTPSKSFKKKNQPTAHIIVDEAFTSGKQKWAVTNRLR
jgi:hypothetical protein